MAAYNIPGIKLNHSVTENPNDRDFKLHMHDDYELFCLASGKVGYIVEGRVYDLRPGSLMLMRSTETHRLLVYGSERYERYTCNFRPELLRERGFSEELMAAFTERGLGERNLYLPEEFSGVEPLALFRQAYASCEVTDRESVLIANLTALLCAVHTVFTACPEPLPRAKEDVGKELIDYINANLMEELSLQRLSDEIHMSPSQINRVFHRLTGTSVYHYILSKRLIIAQSMIVSGESAVSASQKCGFRDYSAFYRLYKKRMGTAPTAVKRESEDIKA